MHCDRTQTTFARDNEFIQERLPSEEKLTLEDAPITSLKTELAWREATVNCYMQAIRFGSRKARSFLARVLRLLIIDVNARRNAEYVMDCIVVAAENKDNRATKDHEHGQASQLEKLKNMTEGERSIRDNIVWSVNTGVSKLTRYYLGNINNKKGRPSLDVVPLAFANGPHVSKNGRNNCSTFITKCCSAIFTSLFFVVRAHVEERRLIDKP